MSIFETLLSSVIAGGLAASALVFLAKTWISERLKRSIEHEYAVRLEGHKALLQAEHTVALEKLRTDAAKERAVESTATAVLIGAHQAAHERRLQALEVLWLGINGMRAKMPPNILLFDMLPEGVHPTLISKLEPLTVEKIHDATVKTFQPVQKVRPFIGEYLYSLFLAYHAFIVMVLLNLMQSHDKGKIEGWCNDTSTQQLLEPTLGRERVKQITSMATQRFNTILNDLEALIIQDIGKVVSGEESATFGLDRAKEIIALASGMLQKQNVEKSIPASEKNGK